MSFKLVSVIVPALNEAESLRELFYRVKRTLENIEQPFEFILVDDGSSDATFETAKRLREEHSNICIIRHARNCGKSMALRHGFEAARGDVAVTSDADLQDQPEMIPRLLDKINRGYDLVVGWRADRKDSLARKTLSKLFSLFVRICSFLDLHDTNCGLKAYRRVVYTNLKLRRGQHRLTPIIAARRGYKVGEVRIEHSQRKYGRSKFRLFRFRGLFDLILLIASEYARVRPLRSVFLPALLGLALAAALFTGWLLSPTILQEETTSASIISTLCGFGAIGCAIIGTILLLVGLVIYVYSKQVNEESRRPEQISEILEAKAEPSISGSGAAISEPPQD